MKFKASSTYNFFKILSHQYYYYHYYLYYSPVLLLLLKVSIRRLGKAVSLAFQLPAGDPNLDHRVQIRVNIMDTYGAESLPIYTYIKVSYCLNSAIATHNTYSAIASMSVLIISAKTYC